MIYLKSFYDQEPFWDDPFYTTHSSSFCAVDAALPNCEKATSNLVDRVFDVPPLHGGLFVDRRRLQQLTTGISNVGATALVLFVILYSISLLVDVFNAGQQIPLVNAPDIEEKITSTIQDLIDALEAGYNTVKEKFDDNKDLLIGHRDVFVCPIGKTNLKTIGFCFFHLVDVLIYNTLDVVPRALIETWNLILTSFDHVFRILFPEHLVVDDVINSIKLFIQRFKPLKDPATEKPSTSSGNNQNDTTRATNKASFYFEPFSDDVISVRDMCVSQCNVYAANTESFIFVDEEDQDSNSATADTTIMDYLFNVKSPTSKALYICQYEQESNFGGTWLLFDDTCLCGSACGATDYFGFSGCADLLDRIGIQCTATTPCTLDRLCPFEESRLTLSANDPSSVLYSHINNVCLDICAELAGFGDFATLVALSAAAGVLPVTNVFGLFSTSFGSPLGVPAALIPGRLCQQPKYLYYRRRSISFNNK